MNNHASQQSRPWMRVAIYSFMTLCVVTIVSILVLVILGYSFNRQDGKLEQGGLLQFASRPTGAAVWINEDPHSSRTNTKAAVVAGNYNIRFERDGYRTWRKSIAITPGQIGWLSYARLIPEELTPQPLREFESLAGALTSPQRNWMLLQLTGNQPVFEVVNLQGDAVRYSTLSLPEESYTTPVTAAPQQFHIEAWSYDEAAILLRHSYDDKQEWIVLYRNAPERSVNINALFAVAPNHVEFAGKGNRLLFVQADDVVRRVNLDDQTLSRPLASEVASFSGYDDKMIAYVSLPKDDKRTVGYGTIDLVDQQILSTYPADDKPLHVAMSEYFNRRYVSVVHDDMLMIERGRLPQGDNKGDMRHFAQVKIAEGTSRLSASTKGRFVAMDMPGGYAMYDLELKKYDKTAWTYSSDSPRPLRWLDDYIVWSDNGGQLRIYDFDGANQYTLMPVVEGFAAAVSPNDKFIYGVTASDKGFELSRVQLIQ